MSSLLASTMTDQSNPAEMWPDWTDQPAYCPSESDWIEYHRWRDELDQGDDQAPTTDDDDERLNLPDWIDLQATRYRGVSAAGDLIADQLAKLAQAVRCTGTDDPRTAADRLDALESMASAR